MKKSSMYNRLMFYALTCSLVLMVPIHAEDEEDTPLTVAMEQTSKALKSLRKMNPDDWAAGAKAARIAADGVRKGMEFEPAITKDMPEGKVKAKAIADYRRIMGVSYAALCELEIAYLEESKEKVDIAIKKVKGSKKEGHKNYTDD